MINYDLYHRIQHLHKQEGLTVMQIAHELQRDYRTVAKWLKQDTYQARQGTVHTSLLDPYKADLVRWLATHPYTAQQCFQKLKDLGYPGSITTLRNYVRQVRPPHKPAYLTLAFEPGDYAQVDWGIYGSVRVGSTRRRLSFFVMVLCYSRLMYVEFTVLQTMEHWLACHHNAFRYFGGIPHHLMIDNLKSAVLQRIVGEAPLFNRQYLDFAHHHGFSIKACGVGKGNEKGRVENGVGYVKKNFLNGLSIDDFTRLQHESRSWLDTIANQRIHGTTRKRPIEHVEEEKHTLLPLPAMSFDVGQTRLASVSNQFRVTCDTNRYSVPAEYASCQVTLKVTPQHICVYHNNKLIARHSRSYDRHQDFEHPDHPRELLAQRQKAREHKLFSRFLMLTPQAQNYYVVLEEKRLNTKHHIQKIVALSELYSQEKVGRAIDDALELQAIGCEYIANLLEQRNSMPLATAALHLTRNEDLLAITLDEPNLNHYED